jgi:hypothetical protein
VPVFLICLVLEVRKRGPGWLDAGFPFYDGREKLNG